ncbi:MAG TPA: LysR family transcriptional regulator [Sulfurovum sp.]|nr:LysR family transcriptional regulator [Sulfurovum sp.]
MTVASTLTLEMLGKPFLLEKRIVLLHAIQEHGSISKAAKVVPMSYKSAWEAVDIMNSLSPEPIVYTETGGKDGGGTTITDYGERLLKSYALLKEEHSRFLERLSELTDIDNGTFKTIERFTLQVSARNQWYANVIHIDYSDVECILSLKLKNGLLLESHITREAAENLSLEVGREVFAIIKSNAIHCRRLSCQIQGKDPQIEGFIEKIQSDKGLSKIVVDVGSNFRVVSVMSTDKIKDLNEDMRVGLWIDPQDILIGR